MQEFWLPLPTVTSRHHDNYHFISSLHLDLSWYIRKLGCIAFCLQSVCLSYLKGVVSWAKSLLLWSPLKLIQILSGFAFSVFISKFTFQLLGGFLSSDNNSKHVNRKTLVLGYLLPYIFTENNWYPKVIKNYQWWQTLLLPLVCINGKAKVERFLYKQYLGSEDSRFPAK